MIINIIFLAMRVFLGLVLTVSGFLKVTQHHQNFVYVLQAYDIVPVWLEVPIAIFFPWVELIVGFFLILGLFLTLSLRLAILMFLVFITILGQAIIRGLDLSGCGCFGSLIQLQPQATLILDNILLAMALVLFIKINQSKWFSLDRYF